MQSAGEYLEAYAEGSASPLSQAAKIAAGPVKHAAEDVTNLITAFNALKDEFESGLDFDPTGDLNHEQRKTIEGMMEECKNNMAAGEKAMAASNKLYGEIAPDAESADAEKGYAPVLRQIDDSMVSKMSVCGGELTGVPKVGLSYGQCAQACDSEAPKSSADYCTAFQYITLNEADTPLCFLFKEISELTTYDCDHNIFAQTSSFLVKKHDKKVHKKSSAGALCAVRFADTNGVTPAMKDGITHIERCFAAEAAD